MKATVGRRPGGIRVNLDLTLEDLKNCGTGAGGFQEGNTCASGGGESFSSTLTMKDVFKEEHGLALQIAVPRDKLTDSDVMEVGDAIHTDMIHMKENFKGVRNLISDAEPTPLGFMGKFSDDGVEGVYYTAQKAIDLDVSYNLLTNESPPLFGSWRVDDSISGAFRHEYGHKFYYESKEIDRSDWWMNVSRDYVRQESTRYRGETLPPVKGTRVSAYGTTSPEELFAESFSAYTSRHYQRGSLPSEIEGFLDKHVRDDVPGFYSGLVG